MDKFFNLDKTAETRRTLHTHTHTGSFLKTIFLIFMLCPVSVFATDVSGGEMCDTDVLNTDTGPVNLRAEFEPEVINLKWYDGDNQITVPTTSNSCTYDTPINLPTDPVKPGYKFKGWKVVPPFDLAELNIATNGIHRYAKTINSCIYDGSGTNCDTRFSDLNANEWKTEFDYGNIYGVFRCSSDYGVLGTASSPTDDNGVYCWCKATGYKPDTTDVLYKSINYDSDIFYYCQSQVENNINTCVNLCPYVCAYYTQVNMTFRQALFGQSN